MNFEYYKVNNESKKIVGGGWTQNEESARIQRCAEGQTLFVLPAGLVDDPLGTPDYTRLKQFLCDKIDRESFAARSPAAQAHALKLDEAQRWTQGADEEEFPFIAAERDFRVANGEDATMESVASGILNAAEESEPLAILEARRVASKAAIRRGENLFEILGVTLPQTQ